MTSEQAKDRLNYLLEDKCDCPQCQLDKEAYRVILKKLKEKTNEALVMRRQRDDIRKSYRDSIPKSKIREKIEELEKAGTTETRNNKNEVVERHYFLQDEINILRELLEEE